MTLGELLKLLRGAILNDRTDRVAGTSDYLWEDATLVTYINEAQRRLAVRGLVLRDGTTPEVTEVVLVPGVDTYVLHPSVIAVMSARTVGRKADLHRVGHSLLSAYRAPTETWMDPAHFAGMPDGATLAFSTDEEMSYGDGDTLSRVTLRVFPVPSLEEAGKTLKLRVVRKPIEPLCVNDLSAIPEVPEDHHIEMLDWAAYLALRIVDDDAGAPARANEFRQSFEEHAREAKVLAMRKMFAPMPWGFGRGGFTWSS